MKKKSARLFGICFILSFISYGWGLELMSITQNIDSLPKDVWENRGDVRLGTIFITLIHTMATICLVTIMSGIVKTYNRTLSALYFTFGISSAIILAIGAMFLSILVPVSELYLNVNDHSSLFHFKTMIKFCYSINLYSYHIGMSIWGIGGLVLCYLLKVSGLVPNLLIMLGFFGYFIFITGIILEIIGHPAGGILFSIPGGVFEIILSVWLIIKGFNRMPV